MAATVATQVRPKIARCIDKWYYGGKSLQDQKHLEILEIMPQYKSYDPHAVLLGYIEGVCGRFDRK